MSAENRLTADQLAALAPGDTVTIGTTLGDRRPSLTPGTVVGVAPAEIVVSSRGRRGGKYVERYRRRDGVRFGGGGRAELVNVDADNHAAQDLLRQRTQRIELAYRQWARRRADVDALHDLHQAIQDYLREAAADEVRLLPP